MSQNAALKFSKTLLDGGKTVEQLSKFGRMTKIVQDVGSLVVPLGGIEAMYSALMALKSPVRVSVTMKRALLFR